MKKLIIILSALLYANQTSASDIGTQMNNLSNFVKKECGGQPGLLATDGNILWMGKCCFGGWIL